MEGITSPACFKEAPPTVTITDASTTAAETTTGVTTETRRSFVNGMLVQAAWQISWASSDASTLSPAPPTLACTGAEEDGPTIGTWVPGTEATGACLAHPSYRREWSQSLKNFLLIGLPILGFAGLLSCATCCYCCYRTTKRVKRAERERVEEQMIREG